MQTLPIEMKRMDQKKEEEITNQSIIFSGDPKVQPSTAGVVSNPIACAPTHLCNVPDSSTFRYLIRGIEIPLPGFGLIDTSAAGITV